MINLIWIVGWIMINLVLSNFWLIFINDGFSTKLIRRVGEKEGIVLGIMFMLFFIPIGCLKQSLKIIEMIMLFCGEEK